jgi:hypothetical protein
MLKARSIARVNALSLPIISKHARGMMVRQIAEPSWRDYLLLGGRCCSTARRSALVCGTHGHTAFVGFLLLRADSSLQLEDDSESSGGQSENFIISTVLTLALQKEMMLCVPTLANSTSVGNGSYRPDSVRTHVDMVCTLRSCMSESFSPRPLWPAVANSMDLEVEFTETRTITAQTPKRMTAAIAESLQNMRDVHKDPS